MLNLGGEMISFAAIGARIVTKAPVISTGPLYPS